MFGPYVEFFSRTDLQDLQDHSDPPDFLDEEHVVWALSLRHQITIQWELVNVKWITITPLIRLSCRGGSLQNLTVEGEFIFASLLLEITSHFLMNNFNILLFL